MRYTLVLLVSAFTGLAMAQGNPRSVKPESTYRRDGLTFMSPNEPGWSLLQDTGSLTSFRRQTEAELLDAKVKVIEIDPTKDDEAVMKDLETLKKAELSELRRDSLHFNYVKFKEAPCVQYDGVFTGDAAVPTFNYFNFGGYLCRHPKKKSVAVQIELSSHSNVRGPSKSEVALRARFFDRLVLDGAAKR
jgi:hypothetical protein